MPIYLFRNPKTGEIKEITLSVNEEKKYKENGIEWDREFTIPNASIDTKINEFSERDFVDKTAKKNYSLGEMWDASKELSQKREKSEGKDSIKEKSLENYSKKRKGIKYRDKIYTTGK